MCSSTNNTIICTHKFSRVQCVQTWAVVRWLVMVNLMTYFPLMQQGTACIRPLEFNFFSSFSVIAHSPFSRNTT